VDTTAPTATITGVAYDEDLDQLILTGTNFDTVVPPGPFASGLSLDWSKLVWDSNGNGDTAPNVTFSDTDIGFVPKIPNNTTLQITLAGAKVAGLEIRWRCSRASRPQPCLSRPRQVPC
jgi:hypothetical protein